MSRAAYARLVCSRSSGTTRVNRTKRRGSKDAEAENTSAPNLRHPRATVETLIHIRFLFSRQTFYADKITATTGRKSDIPVQKESDEPSMFQIPSQ
jgi:hypothetical protein